MRASKDQFIYMATDYFAVFAVTVQNPRGYREYSFRAVPFLRWSWRMKETGNVAREPSHFVVELEMEKV